eukprot:5607170-Pleurochrysis_carterae.AAC.1
MTKHVTSTFSCRARHDACSCRSLVRPVRINPSCARREGCIDATSCAKAGGATSPELSACFVHDDVLSTVQRLPIYRGWMEVCKSTFKVLRRHAVENTGPATFVKDGSDRKDALSVGIHLSHGTLGVEVGSARSVAASVLCFCVSCNHAIMHGFTAIVYNPHSSSIAAPVHACSGRPNRRALLLRGTRFHAQLTPTRAQLTLLEIGRC